MKIFKKLNALSLICVLLLTSVLIPLSIVTVSAANSKFTDMDPFKLDFDDGTYSVLSNVQNEKAKFEVVTDAAVSGNKYAKYTYDHTYQYAPTINSYTNGARRMKILALTETGKQSSDCGYFVPKSGEKFQVSFEYRISFPTTSKTDLKIDVVAFPDTWTCMGVGKNTVLESIALTENADWESEKVLVTVPTAFADKIDNGTIKNMLGLSVICEKTNVDFSVDIDNILITRIYDDDSRKNFTDTKMEIDFKNYTLVADQNVTRVEGSDGAGAYGYWSKEQSDGNYYLKFNAGTNNSRAENTKLVLNPTGSKQEIFNLESNSRYKISFKMKNIGNKTVGIWLGVNDNGNANYDNVYINMNGDKSLKTNSSYEITQKTCKDDTGKTIDKWSYVPKNTDVWTDVEFEFETGDLSGMGDIRNLCLMLQSGGPNNYCIDNIVVTWLVDSVENYWDGTVAQGLTGEGTSANPYKITTAAELAYLAKQVSEVTNASQNPTAGKYYVLENDIDLNNWKLPNWTTKNTNKWYTSTNSNSQFLGDFNGQGHYIKGIYINASTSSDTYGGLFTALGKNAQIKNLGINNSSITAKYAGAFAGKAVEAKIRRSSVGGIVTVKGEYAGGLVGAADKTVAENCWSQTTVVKSDISSLIGGFFGKLTGKSTVKGGWSDCTDGTSAITVFGNKESAATVNGLYSLTAGESGVTKVATMTLATMPALDKDVWKAASESETPRLSWQINAYSDEDDYKDDWIPGTWSGRVAKSYAGGTGKKDDPYLISNAEELAKLLSEVLATKWGTGVAEGDEENYPTNGKYYKLTKNIVINDMVSNGWENTALKQWYTGVQNNCFNGTLDGDGHTISGIYIKSSGNNKAYAGLFPSLGSGAVIKNLGIENSYIETSADAGAFAGIIHYGLNHKTAPKIVACYGGKNVTVRAGGEDSYTSSAGGLIGLVQWPTEIRYCYFLGSAKGETKDNKERSGSLVGCSRSGKTGEVTSKVTIRSCYSASADTPFVGEGIEGVTSENSYTNDNTKSTGKGTILSSVNILAIERMLDTEALTYMDRFDYKQVWVTTNKGTPMLRVFLKDYNGPDPDSIIDAFEYVIGDASAPGKIWSGKVSDKWAGGSGTEKDPYQIATAEQLARLVKSVLDSTWDNYPFKNKYFKITHDIYLNDVSVENWYEKDGVKQWLIGTAPIQSFASHLDGAGHIIYGLYFNQEDTFKSYQTALFPSLSAYGVVENLGIKSSYIYNEVTNAAAFFGYLEYENSRHGASGVIRQCFVGEDVTIISPKNTAAFIAQGNGTVVIEDCYSLASLTGQKDYTSATLGFNMYSGKKKVDENSDKVLNNKFKNIYSVNLENRTATVSPHMDSISYSPYLTAENCFSIVSFDIVSKKAAVSKIVGKKAKETFNGFDFTNVWESVDGITPLLRAFRWRSDYKTLGMTEPKITVSFESYGGTEIEPIVGYAGDKLELPTPTKEYFEFGGWYVYPYETWDVEFTYDFIPDDDITLYAKWDIDGLTESFESYQYMNIDSGGIEDGYEVYRLGIKGYDTKYVYGGGRSMHRLANVEGYKNFSLVARDGYKLKKGAEYKLIAKVYIKGKPSADDAMKLAYLQEPYWAKQELATETITKLSSLESGKWVEVTYKFVAYNENLGISLPAVDMFIDDVYVIETGKAGLTSKATIASVSNGGNWWIYILIAVPVIIVLAGASAVIIVLKKKGKLSK